MTKFVEVLSDRESLVERAYCLILDKIQALLTHQVRVTIALAGGSTPKPLYAALANADLPWERIFIFWGDERYVPADHPDSNERMAREAWLDQVPIPPNQIFGVPTGSQDPTIDAATYEQTIKQAFSSTDPDLPRFDLILLGMGDDGHTASLFPHTAALEVNDRLVTVGNKDGDPRITFTFPLINQAHTVIFLVSGSNKQHALAHVFADKDDSQLYPSRSVQLQDGELWWLMDRDAGHNLNHTV
jgi:6-phosphogluconolactonase